MKRREFLVSSILGTAGALGSVALRGSGLPLTLAGAGMSGLSPQSGGPQSARKILIAGGNFDQAFVRYMATLTGKKRPRLCYLPTASADRPDGIIVMAGPTWSEPFGESQ